MDSARTHVSAGQQRCRCNRRLIAASCTLLGAVAAGERRTPSTPSTAFSASLVRRPAATAKSVGLDHREVSRFVIHQRPCRGRQCVSGTCRAAEDPGRPTEAGLARLQELFDEAREIWMLLAEARW